jgi:hypothetical protein
MNLDRAETPRGLTRPAAQNWSVTDAPEQLPSDEAHGAGYKTSHAMSLSAGHRILMILGLLELREGTATRQVLRRAEPIGN